MRSKLGPLGLLVCLAGCPRPPEPEPQGGLFLTELPPGVALQIDDLSIAAETLERLRRAFAAVRPGETRPAHLRRALTSGLLLRAGPALALKEPRARGLERAEALRQALDQAPMAAPAPPATGWELGFNATEPAPESAGPGAVQGVLFGGPGDLGEEPWAFVRELLGLPLPAEGSGRPLPVAPLPPLPTPWSPPLEGLGRWGLFRVLAAEPSTVPSDDRLTVELIALPYASEAELVDPEAYLRGRRLSVGSRELFEAVQARLVNLLEGRGPQASPPVAPAR